MKKGFTILELLVASLLLSMLVTMLTMIFNQSSMAWNTGIASVGDLEEVRTRMGGYHDVSDDILPGVGQNGVKGFYDNSREIKYRTISIFQDWNGSGAINPGTASRVGRAFDTIEWNSSKLTQFGNQDAWAGRLSGGGDIGQNHKGQNVAGGGGGSVSFIVGVRSSGPNRRMGDEDDITTYPEDVN